MMEVGLLKRMRSIRLVMPSDVGPAPQLETHPPTQYAPC
jgi:hypothetical protein